MAKTEFRQIEWASALFEDGTLTVELSGKSSKEWSGRFATVLSLLDPGHSDWGQVRQTKNRISVVDVREGAEDDLRHFLESVVLQVNSDIAPEEEPQALGDDAESDPTSTVDEQMAATFRSFEAD